MPALPPHHEDFARAALKAYGRDAAAPLQLLSLSENAIYLVDDPAAPAGRVVLRVHRPGYHDLAAIESELAWMAALGTQTPVLTPRSVRSLDGRAVVAATVGEDQLLVDAITYVPGCTAEEKPDAVGYDELGRLTAVMHDHAQSWTPPPAFTRFRWDLDTMLRPQARWGDWRNAPNLCAADAEAIGRAADVIDRRLTEFGCGPDRFGLVHSDLRMANLMVDPDDPQRPLTVIDFDDSGWSWHLADLGAIVSFIEDTPEAERMIGDWLTGYLAVRALPRHHLDLVPTFVLLRRIMLSAWIGTHPESDAAIPLAATFAAGTAELARRYLGDPGWLRDSY